MDQSCERLPRLAGIAGYSRGAKSPRTENQQSPRPHHNLPEISTREDRSEIPRNMPHRQFVPLQLRKIQDPPSSAGKSTTGELSFGSGVGHSPLQHMKPQNSTISLPDMASSSAMDSVGSPYLGHSTMQGSKLLPGPRHTGQTGNGNGVQKSKKLHKEVEQKRRMRMAEQIDELRKWVANPVTGKTDKVSVLQDAVIFVKNAQRRLKDLESELAEAKAEAAQLRSILLDSRGEFVPYYHRNVPSKLLNVHTTSDINRHFSSNELHTSGPGPPVPITLPHPSASSLTNTRPSLPTAIAHRSSPDLRTHFGGSVQIGSQKSDNHQSFIQRDYDRSLQIRNHLDNVTLRSPDDILPYYGGYPHARPGSILEPPPQGGLSLQRASTRPRFEFGSAPTSAPGASLDGFSSEKIGMRNSNDDPSSRGSNDGTLPPENGGREESKADSRAGTAGTSGQSTLHNPSSLGSGPIR